MDEADYVIVGAGSAGCVLAEQLSKDGRHSIIVLESGPADDHFLIDMPRGIAKLMAPDSPRVYLYEVDKGGNHGPTYWLKGRTLGGSSSMNGMVYARGFPSDYDRWEAAGCVGWGWSSMLCHLKANEHHEFGASDYRGEGGPIKVSGHPAKGPGFKLSEAILNAAEQAGVARVRDTNAHPEGGFGYQPRNIWNGKRQSASKAFLRPAQKRANVDVQSDTQVLRLQFDGRRATGVRVRYDGAERTIRAKREVILSAGAVESPKLLMLSGIGPGRRLKEAGVDVLLDVPGVGQNMREHTYLQCKFNCTEGSLNKQFSGPRLLANVLRYVVAGSGPMTHAAQELIGYIKSREGLDRPDCQLGVGLYSMHHGENGLQLDAEPGFTIGGYFMHPQSQGEMYIASPDPDRPPKMMANVLQHSEDQAASVAMVRYIRKIVAQPALQDLFLGEVAPGPEVQTDADILHDFMERGGTAFHVSGTARMGSDDGAVVDPRTRVRGLEGLRVVDTSIFPELPSGNTNAPAMAAGRKAAELILEDARQPG